MLRICRRHTSSLYRSVFYEWLKSHHHRKLCRSFHTARRSMSEDERFSCVPLDHLLRWMSSHNEDKTSAACSLECDASLRAFSMWTSFLPCTNSGDTQNAWLLNEPAYVVLVVWGFWTLHHTARIHASLHLICDASCVQTSRCLLWMLQSTRYTWSFYRFRDVPCGCSDNPKSWMPFRTKCTWRVVRLYEQACDFAARHCDKTLYHTSSICMFFRCCEFFCDNLTLLW